VIDDTELVDVEHVAPLGADDIPDENQSHYCFSCEEPIVGHYCTACGQKNDDFRRSIFSLAIELIASVTALEGRIWRTWGTLLFKPGKVARQFANGRRSYWSSPVRVYLAMSLLLFGYIGITNTQIISLDLDVQKKAGVEKPIEEITPLDLKMTGSVTMFRTQRHINERNADRNFELLDIIMRDGGKYGFDLTDGNLEFVENDDDDEPSDDDEEGDVEDNETTDAKDTDDVEANQDGFVNPVTEIQKGFMDGFNGNPENETDIQEVTGLDITGSAQDGIKINRESINSDTGRLAFQNFLKNPSRFNDVFSSWLPRVMFLMMPFTMLIGIIFIRGRGNALLYDHLVHSAYMHAVIFFVLLMGLIMARIPGLSGGWISLALFGYLFLYLPISLRTMFKRGPIKTIWASYSIGFIYLFLMFIILLMLTALGVKDFVDPYNV